MQNFEYDAFELNKKAFNRNFWEDYLCGEILIANLLLIIMEIYLEKSRI